MIRSSASRESPTQSFDAIFMADTAYTADHQNIPRVLFDSLDKTNSSVLGLMVEVLIRRYEQRLSRLVEEARQWDELRTTIDEESAAYLFVASIQHLVFWALVRNELAQIRDPAPGTFVSCRACVEAIR